MQKNIDTKGRIARAITGTMCVAGGLILVLPLFDMAAYWFWIGCFLIPAGVFQWFEAVKGWCVARACGIKTPM
jgi:uncharacterized membrane protein HdeD (DUF308 family)